MPPENKEEEVVSVGVVFSENQVDSDQIEEVADHFQVSHPPEEVKETQEKPQFMSDKNSLFGYEMPFDVISAGFAALVAGGGIMGYVKAGSVPSLAAGLLFGSVLGIGAYLTSVNPNNYHLTLGTSAVLGGLMGYRFINSGKFMPAGLITILSAGMVMRFGYRALTNWQNQKKA